MQQEVNKKRVSRINSKSLIVQKGGGTGTPVGHSANSPLVKNKNNSNQKVLALGQKKSAASMHSSPSKISK